MDTKNCIKGTTIIQIPDECNGGNFLSTSCIQTPNSLTYLDLPAGSNQTQINAAIISSLTYKDQEISEIPIYDGSETKVESGDNISITGIGTEEEPYIINSILLPVSSTISGIINNTALQELGGVDKLINGIRIGKGNNDGNNNTVLGYDTLKVNTTGTNNTAIGAYILNENTIGSFNTGIGSSSLNKNTIGNYNTSVGSGSLTNNTTGSNNLAVGAYASYYNTTGISNTAVGSNALVNNITNSSNTAMGAYALTKATSDNNTGVGSTALTNLTTGSRNTGIGSGALYYSTTGFRNTAIGVAAMERNTTGGNNVALGHQAGGALTTGSGNILIGTQDFADLGMTTGSNNTLIISSNSLRTGITTGSGNTILGKVTGLSANLTNNVIIADGVGGAVFKSIDTGLTTIPKQTNTLITSGDGKSIITKEYLPTVAGNYANDTLAAAGGVLLGQMYHTAGTVKIRII